MYMMHIPWYKKIFIHNIRLHFVDECYLANSWHIRLFSIAMMIYHNQGNLKGNTLKFCLQFQRFKSPLWHSEDIAPGTAESSHLES